MGKQRWNRSESFVIQAGANSRYMMVLTALHRMVTLPSLPDLHVLKLLDSQEQLILFGISQDSARPLPWLLPGLMGKVHTNQSLFLTLRNMQLPKTKVQNDRALSLSKGFTLIELLVAIMVLAVVGSIVVGIVISTLRGTNKTNNLTDVRQSGDYAISIMSRMIRNSQSIISCANNTISITSPDQGVTEFMCKSAGGNVPATIASNSASLFPISVSVSPCSITCVPIAAGSYQTVTISFTAAPTNAVSADRTASIPFITSVQTRNR